MKQRARVLAVAQSADLGGAELALLRLAPELERHGLDLEFTVPGPGALESELRAGGAAVHRLRVGGLALGAWPRALAAWPRARRRARGADLVLLNGIVTQRLAPAMTATPIVPYIHELAESQPRAWRTQRFWQATPIVLCACEAVAQRCRALGAPPDRLRTVYAPVAASEAIPRPDWADGPVVGYVGRFEYEKGTLDLVRAVRKLPDARLVLVGSGRGAYAEDVLREARALGDRLVELGRVPDARPLLRWFGVLAVPSRREAFATVAAEALAAGTPVVATRSGGVEEYVIPGRNGDLVPPGDPDALAQALASVLPRAAGMEGAAREDAARFAPDRVGTAVAEGLRDALSRRG